MTDLLKINEMFHTFQGESFNSGRRALFIRMPDCNLDCTWCDTEWKSFKEHSEEQFIKFIQREKSKFAVLTGGEPLMNKQLPRIISLLQDEGFDIAVETNGTMPYQDGINWVTCSPKRDAAYKINKHLVKHVQEYKYVVDKDFDFKILDRHKIGQDLFSPSRKLYLSPEFGNFKESLEKIYDYIKENPRWRISLQSHKFMGIR